MIFILLWNWLEFLDFMIIILIFVSKSATCNSNNFILSSIFLNSFLSIIQALFILLLSIISYIIIYIIIIFIFKIIIIYIHSIILFSDTISVRNIIVYIIVFWYNFGFVKFEILYKSCISWYCWEDFLFIW